ncbi:MAG: amidohydrolase family protein [Firmicutes bacterium]|nr:amidohydrolase family protein [Bacillota bacterium]MDD4694403.1 amidohydrolase family protein [Bacillota bacterium]
MISGIDHLSKTPITIETEEGKIKRISQESSSKKVILPGLYDIQINGYVGVDFNSETLSSLDMEKAVKALAKQGVTSFMPTIITNSKEAIEKRLRFLLGFKKQNQWGSFISGFHLEGPFISLEDGPRGAHPKEFVTKPDWSLIEDLQEACERNIKIITLSPEWPGTLDVIEKCVKAGIKVAIGHTAANTQEIIEAAQSGATLSTHLGNGAHPVLPRHPNYIWDQLANDNLWVTLIADGFHLPKSVISVFLKVKKDKAILVSDAVSFAGCAPGIYESLIGGQVELTKEGRLQMVSDPRLLAGSASSLLQTIEFMVKSGLATFEEAWEMASIRPAEYLEGKKGRCFSVGSPADLVLGHFDGDKFILDSVVKQGKILEI